MLFFAISKASELLEVHGCFYDMTFRYIYLSHTPPSSLSLWFAISSPYHTYGAMG